MRRIGIAASKIAQGKLWKYNLFVVLISFLCTMFIFFICGFAILAALFLISVVLRPFMPAEFHIIWLTIIKICMVALAVVMGILNILAMIQNVKFTKQKI